MTEQEPVLLGNPGPQLRRSLINVLGAAQELGGPDIGLVVVQGGGDEWLLQLLEQPRKRRLSGVIVARDERGLAGAVRAGIGGALWAPPATPSLLAALQAAAGAGEGFSVPSLAVEDAAALVAGSTHAWIVVRLADQEPWVGRYGAAVLREGLARVIGQLGAGYLLAVGAAVLLPAKRAEDASAAWVRWCENEGVLGGSRLVWVALPGDAGEPTILDAAGPSRLDGQEAGPDSRLALEPVYEIPSGRRVGWWSRGSLSEAVPDGWLAVPETGTVGHRSWRLGGCGRGPATVPEILYAGDLPGAGEAAAVRTPGWVAGDLRPATPGGLLVERLARGAEAAGMPLWVPNVSAEGLRFLLGLGSRMWVDGPAAPKWDEAR